MPLQRVMRETSSREFLLWCEYLEQQWNERTKQDYYLAQIALEVAKLFKKNPNRLKLKDFLLKFGPAEQYRRPKTQAEVEKHTREMKQAFFQCFGLGSDGKPVKHGN